MQKLYQKNKILSTKKIIVLVKKCINLTMKIFMNIKKNVLIYNYKNWKREKEKAWTEISENVFDIEITGALLNNIEVNASGIHKGNALLKLGEILHINKEEIMAFGDGKNDIKMLETACVGVAMANSVPEVLAVADMITVSNDEDGVAKVIEQYVLR